MKRIISIAFVLILALSCITPVYATEITESTTIELPALPDLRFDEPYPNYYNVYKVIFKVNSDYYAVIYEEPINRASETAYYGLSRTESGCRISILTYVIRYAETYKLSDAGTWDLIYETGSANVSEDKSSEQYLSGFVDFTLEEWQYSWSSRDLVCFCSREKAGVSKKTGYSSSTLYYLITEDVLGDITFTDPDSGNTDDSTQNNNSWTDADKGWLGNLFADLYTFFNNFYNNLKTKLENIASSITTSIGNFISSATSSISTFINNAVSSISGFIDGVISVINSVSASVGEWIAGVVSEIQAIYTGITDFLVSLWSDMWTAISEFFENLFKDITDYFAEKKAETEAITEAFTSFFDSIIMLFEAVFDYSYEESGGVADGTT